MLLTAAPMEGLTHWVFRRLHRRFFGGADGYYTPFITPAGCHAFTERQLREMPPGEAQDTVVQLLTCNAEDFIWASRLAAGMGYREVNLNLGCPAGTVTAKGRGAGFLRDPSGLYRFFGKIFDADLPLKVSVKTRLGWAREEEFDVLADIFNRFPIARLIVHGRVKNDLYRGGVRLEAMQKAARTVKAPFGFNGDVCTCAQIADTTALFPGLAECMVGRGLIADPALFRRAKGGAALTPGELQGFAEALFEELAQAFQSRKNALMHMKEYWFYFLCHFREDPPARKRLLRARDEQEYRQAVREACGLSWLEDTDCRWKKPL